jgi:hypothetical protein
MGMDMDMVINLHMVIITAMGIAQSILMDITLIPIIQLILPMDILNIIMDTATLQLQFMDTVMDTVMDMDMGMGTVMLKFIVQHIMLILTDLLIMLMGTHHTVHMVMVMDIQLIQFISMDMVINQPTEDIMVRFPMESDPTTSLGKEN